MSEKPKKQEQDRRANRLILGRTIFLMLVFGVAIFAPLLMKLYSIQIVKHTEYQAKAIDQQTQDVSVSARRGTIYDSKGKTLAMSGTVYNIIASPLDIAANLKTAQKAVENATGAEAIQKAAAKAANMTPEHIADGLSEILGLDREKLLKRLQKTKSQYEVIAAKVEKDKTDEVREFIRENSLSNGIIPVPDSKRYYPYSNLAAQVIGFVNAENQGAYGMEALYEEELAGKTGRVVTAKNGNGTEMLSRYENYYDATDGHNLTLAIDATIQFYCERILEKGIATFDVQKGGWAIAMDPNTGAILAWANSPNYDLNQPSQIFDTELALTLEQMKSDPAVTEEEYKKALGEAQNHQWRNKAVNDTYEPGSTFKAIVLAAALEEGVVNENDTFTCTGKVKVADREIKCSKREGHGTRTLAQAVADSCNPAFINIGQRLGAETFYQYLEDFGFLGLTGVDMQGEAGSIVWPRSEFVSKNGLTSLATASFGQRLQITPLQLITAAAAVVNGGHLMQPYVLQSITDQAGNVISYTQPTEVRQVVSEQTSQRARTILEGVVNGGTGKNAYQPGYRIGGKTGSSETLVEDKTVVSFLGFAPADDPKVIILLGYDTPKPVSPNNNYTAGGWYISGGVMAARMAGELMGNILDYMGVEKQYTAEELSGADVAVPAVAGLTPDEAKTKVEALGLTLRTVGEGAAVTGQIPAAGASIPGGSQMVLYLGEAAPTDLVTVPNVVGQSPEAARNAIVNAGLYLKVSGVTSYYTEATVASSQSVDGGSTVARGTVIEVRFIDNVAGEAGGG